MKRLGKETETRTRVGMKDGLDEGPRRDTVE